MLAEKTQTSLLDEFVPQYDINEIHNIWVPASPEDAYAEIKAVTLRDVSLLVPLMAARMLPSILRGESAEITLSRPILDWFLRFGFIKLAERPNDEYVIGCIGRFWSISNNRPIETIRTPEEFTAFDERRYSKGVLSITVRPEGSGSRIVTETRVVGTCPEATKLFSRYWLVIRWGSSAIRWYWLNTIRRRLG